MFPVSRRVSPVVVGALVLLQSQVQASPMQGNPVTYVGTHVLLSPSHPAFGAEIAAENRMATVVPDVSIEDLVSEMVELNGDNIDAGRVRAAAETAVAEVAKNGGRRRTNEVRELVVTSDLDRLESHFKTPMERNVNNLPMSGAVPVTPWPSSYWPVYEDGINKEWSANQPSPAEKYATAFGLNATEFERTVSLANGILSMKHKQACKLDGDCANLKDGSACAKRKGETSGYCIPTWFGLCHAWAPAAILETEPKCPVTVGNVTFQPFDIKALMTEIYDGVGVETVFTGARFNGKDDEPNNKDKYGRFIDPTRRDLGAGFFHIAIGNMLGLRNQSFIVDVSAGAEVWNQPVKSYEVLEKKEMTPDDAAWDFYRTTTYPFNPVVQKILYIKNRFKWMLEGNEDGPLVSSGRAEAYAKTADYEYLLELDEAGNILGGEWVAGTKVEHPDFLWFPTGKPAPDTISRVGLSYAKVSDLLTASTTATC